MSNAKLETNFDALNSLQVDPFNEHRLLIKRDGSLHTKKINKEKQGYNNYLVQFGTYSPSFPQQRVNIVPPGIYRINQDEQGRIYFLPGSTMADELLTFQDSITNKIFNEVQQFWNNSTKHKFDEKGLVYKRGIILHGKPGTGKTCSIVKIMEKHVQNGGVVIFNPSVNLLVKGINQMREIESDKKILVIFEEFDRIVGDPEFLSLLDGELQLDNIVYIATTNYIDRIPARIRCRPSRFATVVEVGLPTYEHRLQYFKHKMPELSEDNLHRWADNTEGLVIDQLKDIIVSTHCFDLTFDESIQKLREMGEFELNKMEEVKEDENYEDDEVEQD